MTTAAASPATVSFNHAHDLPRYEAAKVPDLIARMRGIVGAGNVLTSRADLAVYECDGFTVDKNKPDVVVFPTSTSEVVPSKLKAWSTNPVANVAPFCGVQRFTESRFAQTT